MALRSVVRTLIIILGWFSLLHAKDSHPDYSRAFQNFRKLGLPDSKDAQWVRVSIKEQADWNPYSAFPSLYNEEAVQRNAWLLDEDSEKNTFRVILYNSQTKTFSRETTKTTKTTKATAGTAQDYGHYAHTWETRIFKKILIP